MQRTRRHVLVLAAPAFAYLAVVGLVFAVAVQPPPIAWFAFGVAAAVSAALTGVALKWAS